MKTILILIVIFILLAIYALTFDWEFTEGSSRGVPKMKNPPPPPPKIGGYQPTDKLDTNNPPKQPFKPLGGISRTETIDSDLIMDQNGRRKRPLY